MTNDAARMEKRTYKKYIEQNSCGGAYGFSTGECTKQNTKMHQIATKNETYALGVARPS